MELTNDFRVPLPLPRAWAMLTDVERIAPCMPGAQLQEIDGDEHRGVVKVKVGPITAQYKGSATFVELEAPNRAVLRAEGRETRGQGGASATITATLTPDGDGTAVSVVTDLTVTGRVAQFGRGVLADVSAKLLDEFVDCLGRTLLAEESLEEASGGTATAADGEPSPTDAPITMPEPAAVSEPPVATPAPAGPRRVDMPEPTPVDLLGAAGSPVAKRVGPVLAVIAVLWILKKLLSRK